MSHFGIKPVQDGPDSSLTDTMLFQNLPFLKHGGVTLLEVCPG
jgi:hypothetical protein